jgi:ribosomal protein S18 acetylase RimI-like enzyme
MPFIKEITSTETFLVRHPVLRAGKSVESCQFEGDDLLSTKHFGFFIEEDLIGVISIFKNNHPFFKNNPAFQIRGMAVLNNFQKKGLGKKLVSYCENYVKEQNSTLIWFNARENAVGFYKKLGYETIGKALEIKDIGAHYVMFKKLRNYF